MSTNGNIDPYLNYRFKIEVNGIIQGGFSECSGLSSKVSVVEYREGGDNASVRKLPGQVSYPDVTLKWGLTDSAELYNWHLSAVNGAIDKKPCSIIVLGDDKEEKIRWDLSAAWPHTWIGPSFNAKASEVAVEQVILACESITRSK